MPAPPPPAGGRRWWKHRLSPTLARDRCYARSFRSAGLRQAAVPLPDGAVIHFWLPRPDPALQPVLLLHGFGANATWQWAPFLRPLLAAGLAPFVPDLVFFGDSASPTADRSPGYQAASVAAAMAALPGAPQRYTVVGVSYGGFVAYHLAHAFPAVVERLVLVAAGVCLEETDLETGLFAVEDITEAASLLLPQRPEDLRRLVELAFYKPPKFMPSCFIRDYIADIKRCMPTLVPASLKTKTETNIVIVRIQKAASAANVAAARGSEEVDETHLLRTFKIHAILFHLRDYIRVMCTEMVKEKTELLYALISGRKLSDLPKINQQTLIIWGEQDRVFPLELGLRLQRHLGDTSELIIVKNAGHAINREKPAELCRLIKNYIIDPSVKYRDNRKGCWKFALRRFAGSSLRKMDSSRPLI